MKEKIKTAFSSLQALYDEIPPTPCLPYCGACCASPHITFVELLYLLHRIQDQADFKTWMSLPIQPHAVFQGNLACRFLHPSEKTCGVYGVRPYICRLQGHRVIDLMKIKRQENCDKPRGPLPHIPVSRADQWLTRLAEMNRALIPFYAPPFFISGLNIECWLDILREPLFDEIPDFSAYRQCAETIVSRNPLTAHYQGNTGLYSKVRCIREFYHVLEKKDVARARSLCEQIQTRWPATGTYFVIEAQQLLDRISKEDA